MVRDAQQDGQVKPDEDATYIARYIFLVYAGAVRWWIAGQGQIPGRAWPI